MFYIDFKTQMDRCSREELRALCRNRGLPETGTKPDLLSRLQQSRPLEPAELECIQKIDEAEALFERSSIKQLQDRINTANRPEWAKFITTSSTKRWLSWILYNIAPAMTGTEGMDLDPDQQMVLDMIPCDVKPERANPWRLLVVAGPGSGKTKTIVDIVRKIAVTRPKDRILVITYNNYMPPEIVRRLNAFDVRKTDIKVCTIDSYAGTLKFKANGGTMINDPIQSRNIYQSSRNSATTFLDQQSQPLNEWVLLDEAQDIKCDYEGFIEAIIRNTPNFICAGDPRQEIQGNSAWFRMKLQDVRSPWIRTDLRYNHRSHPDIIGFLNDFVRRTMTELVLPDQMPSPSYNHEANKQNGFRVIECGPSKGMFNVPIFAVESIVSLCKTLDPKPFIILPYTINKYNLLGFVTILRDRLYKENIPVAAAGSHVLADRIVPSTHVYICNSHNIKGLEREHTIVTALSSPYGLSEYQTGGISPTLAQLFYVAMSRPMKSLTLVLWNSKKTNQVFPHIIRATGVNLDLPEEDDTDDIRAMPPAIAAADLIRDFGESMSTINSIVSHAFEPVDNVPGSTTSVDFTGYYVEHSIAAALGCLLNVNRAQRAGVSRGSKFLNEMILHSDGEITVRLKKYYSGLMNPFLTAKYMMIERMENMHNDWSNVGVLETYNLHQSQWCKSVAQGIVALFPSSNGDFYHEKAYQIRIMCDRDDERIAVIVGMCPDLSAQNGSGLVELKHATANPAHSMQAALYSVLTGIPAWLINTKEGTASHFQVSAQDAAKCKRLIRAHMQLREVAPDQNSSKTLSVGRYNGLYVFFDTEFNQKKKSLLEVAAVAIDGVTWKPVDVYYDEHPSLKVDRNAQGEIQSGYYGTGYTYGSAESASRSAEMLSRFDEWLKSLGEMKLFAWGAGADRQFLISPFEITDAMKITAAFMKTANMIQVDTCKQEYAYELLLPPNLAFAAHRAFDDALCMACIVRRVCG